VQLLEASLGACHALSRIAPWLSPAPSGLPVPLFTDVNIAKIRLSVRGLFVTHRERASELGNFFRRLSAKPPATGCFLLAALRR
jgi:hypothetical protein